MSKEESIALLDAIETLTSIADLDLEESEGIIDKSNLVVQDNRLYYRTFTWQGGGDEIPPTDLVKKTFYVILKYLRDYCGKEHGYVTDKESVEQIKSIMVLVGESARKLDKYTNLFHNTKAKRVTGLKEYQKLQELYLTRIARRVDTSTLGQWILGLTQRAFPKEMPKETKKLEEIKHMFVDLEAVKKDTDYELLFMRKEDGSRFFNPRLIRNMKLVCDFGDAFIKTKTVQNDPLIDLDIWYDRSVHHSARNILKAIEPQVKWFYQEAWQFKSREYIAVLNKTIMALMMSGNPRNLLEKEPVKSCTEYFLDFQAFLVEAMHSRDYQKYVAYPSKETNKFSNNLLDMTHAVCQALYLVMDGYREMLPIINQLIPPEREGGNLLHERLLESFKAINDLVKRHPNGPLEKALDLFEKGTWQAYDPLHQGNYPHVLFSFFLQGAKLANLRLPTPTKQEVINKVIISDEFKGFLYATPMSRTQKKHFLINLQDRTSWREHARCEALENLQDYTDFTKKLTVVTLTKDSAFYLQDEPYTKENHFKKFIKNFLDQLQDENGGFYFPPQMKEKLFPEFAEGVMHAIHRVFFSEKNVLTREQRLVFIELFYLFLEIKMLEWVHPTTFSFTCKDGVDAGEAASVQLLAFLLLNSKETIESHEWDLLKLCLHVPALLVRGRGMLPEHFQRMLGVIKTIEFERTEFGFENFSKILNTAFSRFYETSFSEMKLITSM